MMKVSNLNIVEIAKNAIEAGMEKEIEDSIVKSHVERFEQNLRERVKEELVGFTVGRLECMRDVLKMRDELSIFIIDAETGELINESP